MANTKEITVTIPDYLYEVALRMTALGLFRDMSELVSAGLRREIPEAQWLLEVETEPVEKQSHRNRCLTYLLIPATLRLSGQ